jgi:hypothetical protein
LEIGFVIFVGPDRSGQFLASATVARRPVRFARNPAGKPVARETKRAASPI